MSSLFSAIALTLFPEMFPGTLGHSLAGTALKKGLWTLDAINIRDFAPDKHKTVDDSPYGGGVGMVMKADVIHSAVEHAKTLVPSPATLLYCTPRGTPFTQSLAERLLKQPLIILCGRFEGVDQRVIDHHHMLEVSLGDFVLSGGEIAALAMLDACVRLLPGVIGKEESIQQESFMIGAENGGLLDYPHYTRPPSWNGVPVPEVLTSGNHEKIHAWRLDQAKRITQARRPDLIKGKKE